MADSASASDETMSFQSRSPSPSPSSAPSFYLFIALWSLILVLPPPPLADALVYCPVVEEPSPGAPPDPATPLSSALGNATLTRTPAYRRYYECPANGDTELIECCPQENRCCPSSAFASRSFYEIDHQLGYIIAILVSSGCLLASVLLLLCCFWSVCPFYNSCRIRYTRDDAGLADKMGEVPTFTNTLMPGESPLGNTLVIAHPIQDKPQNCMNGKAREVAV